MQEVNQQVIVTIIATIVLLLFVGTILLLLAVYYANTKRRLTKEKELLKANFDQTILRAQLEIQEQTLFNLSQEIHDNIGQVLSFVKLNLAVSASLPEVERNRKIEESKELISGAIIDLRDLSKSLSFDNISTNGLYATLTAEVERINRSRLLHVALHLDGDVYRLGENVELVFFRITQEAINNTLKYAGAKYLNICLKYHPNLFTLTITDDGSGFDLEAAKAKNGAGLKNIKSRAGLIGATAVISSTIGHGSEIKISLNPFQQISYADTTYTSSAG
jgi:signal transduction histidine kinase